MKNKSPQCGLDPFEFNLLRKDLLKLLLTYKIRELEIEREFLSSNVPDETTYVMQGEHDTYNMVVNDLEKVINDHIYKYKSM